MQNLNKLLTEIRLGIVSYEAGVRDISPGERRLFLPRLRREIATALEIATDGQKEAFLRELYSRIERDLGNE